MMDENKNILEITEKQLIEGISLGINDFLTQESNKGLFKDRPLARFEQAIKRGIKEWLDYNKEDIIKAIAKKY